MVGVLSTCPDQPLPVGAAPPLGAAPVRQGQPGYAAHLDRDGDGIGCE